MERCLSDTLYARRGGDRPLELELRERALCAELSAHLSGEEYLRIEEELNHKLFGPYGSGRGLQGSL